MSMSRWLMSVALIASLVLITPALRGEDAAPVKEEKPANKKVEKAEKAEKADEAKAPALPMPYRIMVGELQLTEQQVADMLVKVAAVKEAEVAYDKEHGEAIAAAKKATADAKAGGDEAAIKAATAEEKKLVAQRDKALAEPKAAVMAVLTPQQAAKWKCYYMWTGALNSFKKANLSDEQKDKAKAICYSYSAQVEGLKADDKKGMEQIRAAAKKRIVDEVLSDEQKALLPQDAPGKEAKPAPAKEEKKN